MSVLKLRLLISWNSNPVTQLVILIRIKFEMETKWVILAVHRRVDPRVIGEEDFSEKNLSTDSVYERGHHFSGLRVHLPSNLDLINFNMILVIL